MEKATAKAESDGEANATEPPKATPNKLITDPIVDTEIRRYYVLNKPTGKLTKTDLEKVTELHFYSKQLTDVPKELEKLTNLKKLRFDGNQLTDVTGLEKLTQLTRLSFRYGKLTDVTGLEKLTQLTLLDLRDNPDLTKAQIAELKKALPKCAILSDH